MGFCSEAAIGGSRECNESEPMVCYMVNSESGTGDSIRANKKLSLTRMGKGTVRGLGDFTLHPFSMCLFTIPANFIISTGSLLPKTFANGALGTMSRLLLGSCKLWDLM